MSIRCTLSIKEEHEFGNMSQDLFSDLSQQPSPQRLALLEPRIAPDFNHSSPAAEAIRFTALNLEKEEATGQGQVSRKGQKDKRKPAFKSKAEEEKLEESGQGQGSRKDMNKKRNSLVKSKAEEDKREKSGQGEASGKGLKQKRKAAGKSKVEEDTFEESGQGEASRKCQKKKRKPAFKSKAEEEEDFLPDKPRPPKLPLNPDRPAVIKKVKAFSLTLRSTRECYSYLEDKVYRGSLLKDEMVEIFSWWRKETKGKLRPRKK